MANLYGSYDAPPAGGQDLYGSYDMMLQPGGGAGGYDPYANYNSYEAAAYGGPTAFGPGAGGYEPYGGQGGYGPSYGPQRPPHNPEYNYNDIRGVGIVFDQKPSIHGTSPVFVKSVSRGSSADRNGLVRVGDVLVRVNGVSVVGYSIAQLRPIVPGPAGSNVQLAFRRYDGRVYEVTLRRTTPRLGKKNASYFSGIRGSAPPPQQHYQQPPPPPQYYQQPQFYQQPQQQWGASYIGPAAISAAPQYIQQQPIYSQAPIYSGAPAGTILGGGSYIMSQPVVSAAPQYIQSQPMLSTQPISYIQPAQTFATTGQQQTFAYTTAEAHADEIKGTQV